MSLQIPAHVDLMELPDQCNCDFSPANMLDTIDCQAELVSGNTVPIAASPVPLMHGCPLPKHDIVKELKQGIE